VSKQVLNRSCGWSQLVNGGVAGEQVSFQVSSESVNRWRCLNGEWQTVPNCSVQTVSVLLALYCCPSICNAVHCGTQGLCKGLTVVPSRSYTGTSYSLLQTLAAGCIV